MKADYGGLQESGKSLLVISNSELENQLFKPFKKEKVFQAISLC